ncbi:hypothetical protein [Leisingera thetidis]|uniref:hypothetical protein n=1 Tax=Leisingera thetidis TaxID=2930199 RepID=UPI0021F6D796|nr:hypothetical protein [Leisingera thetidis]
MTVSSDLETQARAQAADLGRKAKAAVADKVRDTADAVQSQAAREVQATADAAGAAADTFDPGTMQAQAAQVVAGYLEDAAHRVRTVDVERTVRDVSAFARRNPLLFLGGAALAGFAATRFLKASEPDSRNAGHTQMTQEAGHGTP